MWKRVHLETAALQEGKAVIAADVEAVPWSAAELRAKIELSFNGRLAAEAETKLNPAGKIEFEVENPRLWWPRPYGSPDLYDAEVILYEDEKETDRKSFRFNIYILRIQKNTSLWKKIPFHSVKYLN